MMEALLEASLRLATPLLIAALGELVVQRSGVINVGIEGMMLVGAFAGFAAGAASGSIGFGIGVAIASAVSLGVIFAGLCVWRGSDQIVVGMALNLLALGVTGVALDTFYDVSLPQTPTAATWAPTFILDWPLVGPFLSGQGGFGIIALLMVLGITIFLSYTRIGLATRAVGENAKVASAEGISVLGVRTGAILFGAGAAGCAGALLTLSQTHTFTEDMTAGRGFIALAMVIFGRWHPIGVCGAALFFGLASAIQFRLQVAGWLAPYPLLLMFPYVATLFALAFLARDSRAPADIGQAYHRI